MGLYSADRYGSGLLVCVPGRIKKSGSKRFPVCTLDDCRSGTVVFLFRCAECRYECAAGVQLSGKKGSVQDQYSADGKGNFSAVRPFVLCGFHDLSV